MKCYVKDCKNETGKICRNCTLPVCDEHSDYAQLWFADKPVTTCYACQYKEVLLTMPRKGLRLRETLKNCLWALDSRYPDSVVEINKAVLGYQSFREDAYSPVRVLDLLQIYAPQVLYKPARLVVNAQECLIYLVERSQETPAFRIFCGEHPASQRSNTTERKIVTRV